MGLKSTLSAIFNLNRPIEAPFEALARAVAPLVPDSVTGSPRTLALAGFKEMRDWLTIGFDMEKDKGTAMLSLDYALRLVTAAIEKTPEDAKSVTLNREDVAILRGCCYQLTAAAQTLESIYAKMNKAPRQVGLTDMQTGMTTYGLDYSNVMPMWCRPEADHAAVAEYLRETHNRLDAWLATTGVRPASDGRIRHYLPYDPKKPIFD